jgi:hypothetical protein
VVVGVAVSLLAAAAMAVDHLLEDEGAFPADAGTFVLSSGLSFALALAVFGWLVPRSSARTALVLAVVALLAIPLTLWLGLPFVLAGGAVLAGRRAKGRAATVAVAIGAVVLLLGTAAYAYVAVDKLA